MWVERGDPIWICGNHALLRVIDTKIECPANMKCQRLVIELAHAEYLRQCLQD